MGIVKNLIKIKSDKNDERDLVVLDIDSTMLNAVKPNEKVCVSKILCWGDSMFVIYPRPYLLLFLTYLSNNYRLAIWSAGDKNYVHYIAEKILFPHYLNKIESFSGFEFIWSIVECRESLDLYGSYKSLQYLLDKKPHLINRANTIIIDDCKSFISYFDGNIISVPPYFVASPSHIHDNILAILVKSKIIEKKFKKIKSKPTKPIEQ